MTNFSLADGDAAGNVRCPVSRRALVAGFAGALGATAAEHQHRQAHPEQGSRHGQRPQDRRRGLVRGEWTHRPERGLPGAQSVVPLTRSHRPRWLPPGRRAPWRACAPAPRWVPINAQLTASAGSASCASSRGSAVPAC
jgi:hypothetical protein